MILSLSISFGSTVKNAKKIRPKKMKIPKPINTFPMPKIGMKSPERITNKTWGFCLHVS